MTETVQRTGRTSLEYPEVPVGAVLVGAAHRRGDRTALHFLGRELSFAQIHDRARAFANALRPGRAAGGLRGGRGGGLGAGRAGAGRRAGPDRRPAGGAHRPGAGPRPGAPGALDAVPGAVDFEEFRAGAPTTDPGVEIDVRTDLAHLAHTGARRGAARACSCRTATSWSTRCSTRAGAPGPSRAMGSGLNVPNLTGSMTVLHERFDPGAYLADAERFRVTGFGGAPPLYGARCRPGPRPATTWPRCRSAGAQAGAARPARPERVTTG